jgi:hypothetical protein
MHLNHPWLIFFLIVSGIAAFGLDYFQHKRTGLVFPKLAPELIMFEEYSVSGCSHESNVTRMKGAKKCLHITVTESELWIRPTGWLCFMAPAYDLEHRIAKSSLSIVEPLETQAVFSQTVVIDYRDEQNQYHRLSLKLKSPEDFLKALGLQNRTA